MLRIHNPFCAAGILAAMNFKAIARRAMFTGSASYLDIFILAPGIHVQQMASEINVGEHPRACDMSSGYVFLIQNPATISFLLRISKTGFLTKVHVSPPLPHRTTFGADSFDLVLYIGCASLTIGTIGILAAIADWWALTAVFALMAARLLNIIVVKRRAVLGWKGAFESGDADLFVILSRDRWVRIQGAMNDVKNVTAGSWLQKMSDEESCATVVATLFVYLSTILAFNASIFGSLLLVAMIISALGLLGLANTMTRDLHMFRHVVRVAEEPKIRPGSRFDVVQQLVLECASDTWAIALGLVPPRPQPGLLNSSLSTTSLRDRGPHLRERHFVLGDRTLRCDIAPWEHENRKNLPNTPIGLPSCVEARMHKEDIAERRTMLWGTVMMAKHGNVTNDTLFTLHAPGRSFTLEPDGPGPCEVPLQSFHTGPNAIPDALADISCADTSTQQLFDMLYPFLRTDYSLHAPHLRNCIEYVRDELQEAGYLDLGYLYGYLRQWWHVDFTAVDVRSLMMKRKKDDQDERNEAVQDHCVTNPHVPPRRVWDLYSNRVLPFFALPERLRNSTGDVRTLDRLWAISHSWVDEEDRQTVDTAINGRQWGVPFPRRTSLSNVRIELLNLGAEYVWLDVLCLRQADESKDSGSNTRTNEWKLDVPTIGNIYSAPSRICVIYFNGLGLSLSVSPDLLKSDRHWFNRVWTLQELCDCWLPGGLTGSSTVYEGTLFTRLKKLRKTIEDAKYDAKKLWPIIRERHCTNDVDRIAGLTYLTPHSTLPVYVEKLNLLLKNLRPEFLTWLFLGCPHDLGDLSEGEKLQLVNREQLYTDSPGSFSQTVYMLRPCRILSSSNKAARREWQGEEETVELWFPPNTFARVKITVWGVVRPDVTYSFLGLGDLRYWILTTGAPEGERDGRLRVVEWGIAHMEAQQAQRLVARGLGRSKTEVVYDQKLRSDGESDPQVRSLRDLKGRRSSVQRLLEGMPLDLW